MEVRFRLLDEEHREEDGLLLPFLHCGGLGALVSRLDWLSQVTGNVAVSGSGSVKLARYSISFRASSSH